MERISEYLREYEKNESIDYHFTGSTLVEVWVDGEIDIKETIHRALKFFKQFHRTISSAGQYEALEILAATSLLGEAYYNAVLAWNNGGTQMIPSSRCFYAHLKILTERLVRDGFEISEEWTCSVY